MDGRSEYFCQVARARLEAVKQANLISACKEEY